MSRLSVVALVGLALLVMPAAAQTVPMSGATLTLRDLPAPTQSTNQTFLRQTFDAGLSVQPGACSTGGTATLDLVATVDNKTLRAEISPSQVAYNLGVNVGTNVGGTRNFETEFAVVVSTPQLVTVLTNATVTVTATPSFACSTPVAGVAPTVAAVTGTFKVSFKPDLANKIAGASSEVMPGLELPLLAAALVAVALVVRRKQA